MHTLYWDQQTAAFAAQALLEETGTAYRIVRVDLAAEEHRRPDYLALNPGGYVPTLVTDEGRVLGESAAILLYLADLHPELKLTPKTDEPDRGTLLRWLFFLTNAIQSAYKRYYYATRYSTDPADAPRIKAKARDDLIDRWGVVEAHLVDQGPYLLGEGFSAADVFLLMLATWFDPPEALLERSPAIDRCVRLVAARPAIARALAANGEDWLLAGHGS